MKHIIYIPGLGDRYDIIRRLGLALWRRPGVRVTHVPMRWLDANETMTQKVERVRDAIDDHTGDEVTIIGESAGGGMAIVVAAMFAHKVSHIVTVCGMNRGEANVSPLLYQKNPAFRDVMRAADRYVADLSTEAKAKMYIIYSSLDYTVRPRNSLIDGVDAYDTKIMGHAMAILSILFWGYRRILSRIS